MTDLARRAHTGQSFPTPSDTPQRLGLRSFERRAFAGGVAALVGLAAVALRPKPNRLDVAITTRLQRRKSPAFARVMKLISSPGYAPFTHSVVLSLAATLWALGRRRDAIFAVGTMGAGFTSGVIKLLVGRPRPDLRFRRHQRTFKDNSFPSGHATHYTVFYGYVCYLAWRYLPAGPLRLALMGYCATLIALVGPSRVYLGHHWASDVIAGQLVGSTYLMAMLQVYEALDTP
jgi:undecaprenyl-diphosphatase